MPGAFIPPTPIIISFVSTASSFTQTATQQIQFLTDRTNPQYLRQMLLTQDGVYMQIDTASAFIAKANLYAMAVNVVPTITWPPIIITQPTSSIVTHLSSSYFRVSASAETPITYSWYSSSYSQSLSGSFSQLTNSAVFTGSNTSFLTVSSSVVGMNQSQFFVVCSNVSGQTTSSAAFLTVN